MSTIPQFDDTINAINLNQERIVSDKKNEGLTMEMVDILGNDGFVVSEHPFRITNVDEDKINEITPDVTAHILDWKLPNIDKRIKNILVELLQNVLNNQSKGYEDKATFLLEQTDGKLHMQISNYLDVVINEKDKEKEITSRLDAVNTMKVDGEDPHAEYKRVLDET